MNLQPLFTAIFVGAWCVAFGSGVVGTYWRIRAWREGLLSPYRSKYHRSIVVFIGAWAVGMGIGLLAVKLGYEP